MVDELLPGIIEFPRDLKNLLGTFTSIFDYFYSIALLIILYGSCSKLVNPTPPMLSFLVYFFRKLIWINYKTWCELSFWVYARPIGSNRGLKLIGIERLAFYTLCHTSLAFPIKWFVKVRFTIVCNGIFINKDLTLLW